MRRALAAIARRALDRGAALARPPRRATPVQRAILEELEPRVLYSADSPLAWAATAVVAETRVVAAAAPAAPAPAAAPSATAAEAAEIAFVDAGVAGHERLVAALHEQAAAGRAIDVVVIDAGRDGLAQIGDALRGRSGLAAIHVVSHGGNALLELGSTRLDAAALDARAAEIAGWRGALADGADLLLYGCDVAADAAGRDFVDRLAALTGADVAASSDATGSAALGGDWVLEYRHGPIEALAAPNAQAQRNFDGLLAVTTGTTTSTDGTGSNLLTFAHTVGTGADRLLVVNVGVQGGNSEPITAVSYGGAALTRVGQVAASFGANTRAEIWVLTAPAAGTADVVVSLSANLTVSAGATHFFGVDPAVPTGAVAGEADNGRAFGVNVAAAAGDLVFGMATSRATDSGTAGTGQTLLYQRSNGSGGGNLWSAASTEPGASTVAMDWTTSGGATGEHASLAVTLRAAPGPVVDLDADDSSGATVGGHRTGFRALGPVAIADVDATIVDAQSSTLASLTVTLTNRPDGIHERLAANTAGTAIGVDWNAATGVLTLSGTDTLARYQQVLRSVTYDNTAATPNQAERTVTVVARDGTYTGNPATATVRLFNQPPTVTVPATPQAADAVGRRVFSAALGNAITVADADARALPVQVTLTATQGTVTLSRTTGLSFAVGDGSADATTTFTGTLAAINAALDGLVFDGDPFRSGTGGSVLVAVDDLGNTGIGAKTASATATVEMVAIGAPHVVSGVYAGTAGGQAITGLGFRPDVVIVKQTDGGQVAVIATSAMPGGQAKVLVGNDLMAPGQIVSLDADGFSVGALNANGAGQSYTWTAFKASSGVLTVGSYGGSGAARSIGGVGFAPELVWIVDGSTEEAVYRSAADPRTWDFSRAVHADAITALEADGFRVGAHAQVNRAGDTYYYVAWNEIAGAMDVGSYVGDNVAGRTAGGVGFAPEFLMVHSTAGTDPAIHRTEAQGAAADVANFFGATASQGNRIQRLLADGFELGSDNDGNESGSVYTYAAWRQQTAPTISAIGAVAGTEDVAIAPVAFTVGDAETAAGSLSVRAASSNPALIADTGLVLGGSGANRTLTMTPRADANGSATVTVSVSDGRTVTSRTFTVTVGAVNDAPVATATTAALAAVAEDSAEPAGATVASLFGALIDDRRDAVAGGSSANAFAGVAVVGNAATAAQGRWQWNAGSGWSDVPTAASTAGALLLAPASLLRFVPAPDHAGTPGSLTVRLADDSAGALAAGTVANIGSGGGSSRWAGAADAVTLSTVVTAVDDAPVVATTPTPLTVVENAPAAAVDDALRLSDVDSTTVAGATVAITANHAAAQDVLAFADTGSITGSWNAATGVLTLSGSAGVAEYEAALRSVTYRNTSDAPSTATRTVAFTVGGSTATRSIAVSAVNDAPTLAADAVVVLAATDEDSASPPTTVGALLAAAGHADVDADAVAAVSIVATTGNGRWQYATGDGSWTAFGPVSPSAALLLGAGAQLRYLPDAANGESATLDFVAWDQTAGTASTAGTPRHAATGGGGGSSAWSSQVARATIAVSSVADAPVLDAARSPTLADAVEDDGAPVGAVGTPVSALVDFATPAGGHDNVVDVDAGALLGIAVTAADTSHGRWRYTTDGGATWQPLGAVDASHALLLAADAGTRIHFEPTADFAGTIAGAITFRAWDRSSGVAGDLVDPGIGGGRGAYSAAVDTAALVVAAVNDAPTIAAPATATTAEDTAIVFAADHGNAIAIDDVDAGGTPLRVTLTATHGTVTLAATTGLTFAVGDGSADATTTFSASLAAVAQALAGMRFVPDADHAGGASLRIAVDDQGHAGSGGALGATRDVAITVTPVDDAPTGRPAIVGSATEDATLAVDTASIADADGLGPYTVQWLRDGIEIAGATATTHVLGDADVGAAISVRVSWTDGGGTAESLASAPTAAVANVDDAPSGRPTVVGSAVEDAPLAADTASIADADGVGPFGYRWLRDGVEIAGATAATYTAGDADVGARLAVRVDWTDGHGHAESLTSAATAPVANRNDTPTGAPAITGTAVKGEVLAADTRGLADADGLGPFTYRWRRDGVEIAGATAPTLTLVLADVGARIDVVVGWTDGHGTLEAVASAATAPVAHRNSAPTGAPQVVGDATEDRTLAVDTSAIADADDVGAFAVQWLRDGVEIAGATAATLALGDADVDRAISVRVAYTDAAGTAESLTSAPTAPVANVDDAPTGAPAIVGDAVENRWLQVATAAIADADGLGAFGYRWLRDGVEVAGATTPGYRLGNADVGARIGVVVDYVDGHGTRHALAAAPTAPVADVDDAPTGAPAIVGAAVEDGLLAADTAAIADADGLGPFGYRWLRDGVEIAGATAATYAPGDADVGRRIGLQVSYVDAHGNATALAATPTAAVANVDDAPLGVPVVVGSTHVGETLVADTAAVADADGLGAFAHRWLRDGVPIDGATGAAYTTGVADVGARIGLRVDYVDGHGTATTLSAAETGVVHGNRAPGGRPAIVGSAVEDGTLVADVASIADADGLGPFAYRWLRDGVEIAGATAATYTAGDADVGARLAVVVGWTDGLGRAESLTSAATAPLAGIDDAPRIVATSPLRLDEGARVVIDGSRLQAADADDPAERIAFRVAETPAHGRIERGGVAVDAFTQADIDAGRIFYVHGGSEAASDRFSFVLADAAGGAVATVTLTVAVAAVDDAPELVLASTAPAAATADGGAQRALPAASVADADSARLVGATVRIAAGYRVGSDRLLLDGDHPLTAAWDPATATLTLSGPATPAAYATALGAVRFAGTDAGSGERVLAVRVDDASGASPERESRLAVRAVPAAAVAAPVAMAPPVQMPATAPRNDAALAAATVEPAAATAAPRGDAVAAAGGDGGAAASAAAEAAAADALQRSAAAASGVTGAAADGGASAATRHANAGAYGAAGGPGAALLRLIDVALDAVRIDAPGDAEPVPGFELAGTADARRADASGSGAPTARIDVRQLVELVGTPDPDDTGFSLEALADPEVGGGLAVSASVLWWATRAGGLMAAMFASVPAWRSFDPTPILERRRPGDSDRDRDGARDGDDDPDDLVESMLAGDDAGDPDHPLGLRATAPHRNRLINEMAGPD